MARKQFATPIEEELTERFKKKCKENGLKYNEAMEALMEFYVDGGIEIQLKTSYIVKPK